MSWRPTLLLLGASLWLAACQMDSRQQVLAMSNTQAQQRAISTRAFDTADRRQVFRAVISTLQDLGFVVDRADDVLHTVSATRFGTHVVRLTVTVRAGTGDRTLVRASGQFNQDPLADATTFQRLFEALSQALFLQANQID
ncbi:hypothetical protein ACLF3G_06065 [Falsiroseomonas sp. HC035]|uniref:hypothetical protein n=1 Tax=Falsiroseomonas sp. HC035 TaxID=3390999 RepID=UPI003D3107C4